MKVYIKKKQGKNHEKKKNHDQILNFKKWKILDWKMQ